MNDTKRVSSGFLVGGLCHPRRFVIPDEHVRLNADTMVTGQKSVSVT